MLIHIWSHKRSHPVVLVSTGYNSNYQPALILEIGKVGHSKPSDTWSNIFRRESYCRISSAGNNEKWWTSGKREDYLCYLLSNRSWTARRWGLCESALWNSLKAFFFFFLYTLLLKGELVTDECENVTAIPIFNLSEQTSKIVGGEELFCFTYEKYYKPAHPLL